MAVGLFRAMFSMEGNASGIEGIKNSMANMTKMSVTASQKFRVLGQEINKLSKVRATGLGVSTSVKSIELLNQQAQRLQPVLLSTAKSVEQLGVSITGLTPATAKYSQEVNQLLGLNLNLSAENVSTAKSFFSVSESIRDTGATGQITSTRLKALSQTLSLFAQNTGQQADAALQQLSGNLTKASAAMKKTEQSVKSLNLSSTNLNANQRITAVEAEKLSQKLLQAATVTGLTAQQAKQLSTSMLMLAQNAHPMLSEKLAFASQELRNFAAQSTIAEGQLRQSASTGGFKMMQDVSAGTQQNFRQLSSASQGLMISLALTQGNVMGLAFSLIFLQFSGFLKLSLGI
ncbi:hypothetical protein CL634_01845, partial [bacterium]|nr:hypothetical protein [bacterium]